MQADITLSGTGYDYLYVGTAKDAEKASKDQLIAPKENCRRKMCIYSAGGEHEYWDSDCSTWVKKVVNGLIVH